QQKNARYASASSQGQTPGAGRKSGSLFVLNYVDVLGEVVSLACHLGSASTDAQLSVAPPGVRDYPPRR
ncbi:MAG TPA: hypothetical protein P5233_20775, partial [Candidatus Paceibacterota bacterium]|nr:hypothetical protein [Candidatus Paceibacterota bacterium]